MARLPHRVGDPERDEDQDRDAQADRPGRRERADDEEEPEQADHAERQDPERLVEHVEQPAPGHGSSLVAIVARGPGSLETMSLTLGTGPLAGKPGGDFNFGW